MGTCLASDNRVFLGADGIGIHHLKMYELLFTFGFISTTVNCNNKAEWKWLTSVKLSKCKCLLVWRHKSFLYYINHFDHWTGSWGVLQGCGWLLFSLHPSSALTETDRYATHLFRKAITLFFFFIVNWISRKHLPKAWSRMIKVWAGTLQWNGSKDGEGALISLKLCERNQKAGKQQDMVLWK